MQATISHTCVKASPQRDLTNGLYTPLVCPRRERGRKKKCPGFWLTLIKKIDIDGYRLIERYFGKKIRILGWYYPMDGWMQGRLSSVCTYILEIITRLSRWSSWHITSQRSTYLSPGLKYSENHAQAAWGGRATKLSRKEGQRKCGHLQFAGTFYLAWAKSKHCFSKFWHLAGDSLWESCTLACR